MEQQEPTAQDIVNQFLSEMLEGVKQAGAFVSEQLPLVLQEYITWGIVSSVVWLLPVLFAAYYIPRMWRWGIDSANDSEGLTIFLCTVATILWLWAFLYHALDMAKAIFAPRVYLIDELSKLL